MTRQRTSSAKPAVTAEPVTAENYVARASAYIRAHGGLGVVVRSPNHSGDVPRSIASITPDEQKWRAWMAYLASKNIPTKYARTVGHITTPADWPRQFDAGGFGGG